MSEPCVYTVAFLYPIVSLAIISSPDHIMLSIHAQVSLADLISNNCWLINVSPISVKKKKKLLLAGFLTFPAAHDVS